MDMFRNTGLGLRILREWRGKSIRALAVEAGIGKSQLSKYENGRELPKLDSLQKILRALSVSAVDFFSLTTLLDRKLESLSTPEKIDDPFTLRSFGLFTPEITAAFEKVMSAILEAHHLVVRELALKATEPKGRNVREPHD